MDDGNHMHTDPFPRLGQLARFSTVKLHSGSDLVGAITVPEENLLWSLSESY